MTTGRRRPASRAAVAVGPAVAAAAAAAGGPVQAVAGAAVSCRRLVLVSTSKTYQNTT